MCVSLPEHLKNIADFERLYCTLSQRHPHDGWLRFEMLGMLEEVNRKRTYYKLPQVSLEIYKKVETRACGHADYAHKLALYSAELAEGLE